MVQKLSCSLHFVIFSLYYCKLGQCFNVCLIFTSFIPILLYMYVCLLYSQPFLKDYGSEPTAPFWKVRSAESGLQTTVNISFQSTSPDSVQLILYDEETVFHLVLHTVCEPSISSTNASVQLNGSENRDYCGALLKGWNALC